MRAATDVTYVGRASPRPASDLPVVDGWPEVRYSVSMWLKCLFLAGGARPGHRRQAQSRTLIATAAPKPRGGIRTAAIAALLCLLAPWSSGQSLDIGTPPEPAPAVTAVTAITAVDTAGIQRDTAYFLGHQFAAVGLISLWPQSETS